MLLHRLISVAFGVIFHKVYGLFLQASWEGGLTYGLMHSLLYDSFFALVIALLRRTCGYIEKSWVPLLTTFLGCDPILPICAVAL